jgi:hypothetical protein
MSTQTQIQKKYPKIYDLVAKKPVARFYYQGTHTHPVRRTVLIIEEKPNLIVGYEFREGQTVRTLAEALNNVKSYRKDRIAKWGDYKRLRMTTKTFLKSPEDSTLERFPILVMFSEGA